MAEPDGQAWCRTCVRDWLDTLAVLDAVRTGDEDGARLVLGQADTAEVAIRLARVIGSELGSDLWAGPPLEDLVAAQRTAVLRGERELAGG